ncbi:MAG: hypothetical protein WD178_09900, partial [Actinomycetota bacterium]
MQSTRGLHSRRRPGRAAILAITIPLLAVVAVVIAWSLDGGQNGRVARNVALAGRPVGGLDREQLTAVAAQVAGEYATAPVTVEAPQGGFVTNAEALSLTVQVEPTVTDTLALESAGSVVERIWGWGKSFFTARLAPVRISVDRNAVYRVVASADPGPRTPPAEPTIRAAGGG